MSERYRAGIANQAEVDGTPVTVFATVKSGPNKLEVTVKLPAGEALAEWELGI